MPSQAQQWHCASFLLRRNERRDERRDDRNDVIAFNTAIAAARSGGAWRQGWHCFSRMAMEVGQAYPLIN